MPGTETKSKHISYCTSQYPISYTHSPIFSRFFFPTFFPMHQDSKFLSHAWLFVTPWTEARQASLSITSSQSLLKLMSIESVMPFNHLIFCRPFSSRLQSFPASGCFPMSQFFSSGGQSIGASASASVLPMNTRDWFPLVLTGLISFAIQRTLKNLLQHHSSKASILRCSDFFVRVQLSNPYMTTGKAIGFTTRIFVGKVMSLLF